MRRKITTKKWFNKKASQVFQITWHLRSFFNKNPQLKIFYKLSTIVAAILEVVRSICISEELYNV